jgi:hypothetical protein
VLDLAPSDGNDGTGRTVVAIGPKTAEVASDLGFRVDVVALDHTAEGLIEAVAAHLSGDEDEPESEEGVDGEDAATNAIADGPPPGPEGGTIGR